VVRNPTRASRIEQRMRFEVLPGTMRMASGFMRPLAINGDKNVSTRVTRGARPPPKKIGTFQRILLADESFGYARQLEFHCVAFYDYRTFQPDADLDKIASAPVLFKICVRILRATWETIGWRPLEQHLKVPIVFFMQDRGKIRDCTIYDSAGGERVAFPEECIGLERSSVWEQHGAEERLLDALMRRPNDEVERSKVWLP